MHGLAVRQRHNSNIRSETGNVSPIANSAVGLPLTTDRLAQCVQDVQRIDPTPVGPVIRRTGFERNPLFPKKSN